MNAACTAPVALFVYNRPVHARKVLEALAANPEARDTDLIIFSDGPRHDKDVAAVEEVRACVAGARGFRSVFIHKRETNAGLADSIVEGVSSVLDARGRVIVLEDDIVVSRHFLRYMNDALTLYENDEKVMHIAAWLPPIQTRGLPETFFLRHSSCWGWATWARAWKHFTRDSAAFLRSFSAADIRRFNLDGSLDYWSQIVANHEGRLKTWAVFWYASVFSQGGLCLHPHVSCTRNIGFDGSGENCGRAVLRETPLAQVPIAATRVPFVENRLAMERIEAHFRGTAVEAPSAPGKRPLLAIRRRKKTALVRRAAGKNKGKEIPPRAGEKAAAPSPQLWIQDETTLLFPTAHIDNTLGDADKIRLGKHTAVRGELFLFAHGGEISIGDYCYVGEGTRIWSARSITIGDRVLISHNVNIFDTDTHPIDDPVARHAQYKAIITTGHPREIEMREAPIVIEDDALICCQSVILRGVHIGRAAVVGAGAVVTHDVPPYTVVAGNPARVVRVLPQPSKEEK